MRNVLHLAIFCSHDRNFHAWAFVFEVILPPERRAFLSFVHTHRNNHLFSFPPE